MPFETAVAPSGPYSLRLSAALASDATRRYRRGRLTVALAGGELAEAWQRPDGTVAIRAQREGAIDPVRFILGLADDHSPFVEHFADDPLIGRATKVLRGLRPPRLATVAHAVLRALCGQLVTWQQAKEIERNVIRQTSPFADDAGLYAPPTQATLGSLSAAELRRLGLHARRAAALVRLCRSLDLEGLRELPTEAVAARLERERGLGPWSVGVICLQGLGRFERGLVGDLGLIKLCSRGEQRRLETAETAALLAPYGRWAGLASVYLLRGLARGLVPVPDRPAAPRAA